MRHDPVAITALADAMERSVRDAACTLQQLYAGDKSSPGILLFTLWPKAANELRLWVPGLPWHISLEMDMPVCTREARWGNIWPWLHKRLYGKPADNSGVNGMAVPVMLHAHVQSLWNRLLYRMQWHSLRISIRAEKNGTDAMRIKRRLFLDNREYLAEKEV